MASSCASRSYTNAEKVYKGDAGKVGKNGVLIVRPEVIRTLANVFVGGSSKDWENGFQLCFQKLYER
ncbi:hypothetical protein TNCV_1938631 [Trichonephila clavipes]|nr:hypothetical protein TNCV_1938631 [Trichonephila clavipes]